MKKKRDAYVWEIIIQPSGRKMEIKITQAEYEMLKLIPTDKEQIILKTIIEKYIKNLEAEKHIKILEGTSEAVKLRARVLKSASEGMG